MRSLALVLLSTTALASAAAADVTHYVNAQVWTGDGFERRTLAVEDGRFVSPAEPASTRIDLEGQFIVPAYGNAHHHITNPNAAGSWNFVGEGVFYVWNPNLLGSISSDAGRAFYARTDTVDVQTSYGGITEPGGHPEPLYTVTLRQYVYPDIAEDEFLGDAFHYGRTREQIDAALDLLVEQRADFVKTYLLYSEEYETRRDDDTYGSGRGLNPANYAYLVEAAQDRGLPVATHVETAHDFRVAAEAGVDMFGHLPGYSRVTTTRDIDRLRISEEAAAIAAEAGSLAVPTYRVARNFYEYAEQQNADNAVPEDIQQAHYALQADNLQTLSAAGMDILTGTDAGFGIFDEIEHMVDIGGLSTAEALDAVFGTGAHLFPDRRIGCFDAGCEANFLVLAADPTQDITALRRIERRIKGGEELSPPPQD